MIHLLPSKSSGTPRAGTGALLQAALLTLQGLLVPDFPIRFSPALLGVMVLSWWLGPEAASGALLAGALGVNLLLLEPRWQFSTGGHELLATLAFVLLAAFSAALAIKARQRLDALLAANARTVEQVVQQSSRLKALEQQREDDAARSSADAERARSLLDTVERVERYAHALERRVAETEELLRSVPLPLVVLENEEGVPVVRLATAEVPGANREEEVYRLLADRLVATSGAPFTPQDHPLNAAMRGEAVRGREAAMIEEGALRPVRVYARYHRARHTMCVAWIPERVPTREGPLH